MITPDSIAATAEKDFALLQTPEAQAILRAFEARLAAIPQVATLEARLDQTVPGWRTSEFWMTNIGTLGLLLASIAGLLPAKYAVIAAGLSQSAYNLSRGMAKGGAGK